MARPGRPIIGVHDARRECWVARDACILWPHCSARHVASDGKSKRESGRDGMKEGGRRQIAEVRLELRKESQGGRCQSALRTNA